MNNLKEILLLENKKYPLMEITDYVKLIFQYANGGNHLLNDKNAAKNYLNAEYNEILARNDIPLYEEIGNNIIRINLARFKYEKFNIDSLFLAFIKSASLYSKDDRKMDEAFDVLKDITKEGSVPFSYEELDEYLSLYKKKGYPLLSHSETYKKHYDPHYRIIAKQYLNEIIK